MFNPDEFSNPQAAFFLGFNNFCFYIIIELINIVSLLRKDSVPDIISRFFAYSILLTIPQIYMRQRKMFNIKFDVDDFFLTIHKKEGESRDSTMNVK